MPQIHTEQTVHALGPDNVEIASAVFETAWRDLETSAAEEIGQLGLDLTRAILARRIVTMVAKGEHDPARLRRDAIEHMKARSWAG